MNLEEIGPVFKDRLEISRVLSVMHNPSLVRHGCYVLAFYYLPGAKKYTSSNMFLH
jgi:hypothetical protein